jgi:hypothetical protein
MPMQTPITAHSYFHRLKGNEFAMASMPLRIFFILRCRIFPLFEYDFS